MVSLARNLNSFGSGGGFCNIINMDEEECLQPVLASQEEEQFHKLNTVHIVAVPLVFGVGLLITGIVIDSVWPEEQSKCNTYFIYLYLHCAYWLIVLLADHLVKTRHHKLRIYGYLDFYQSTYQQIRTPLFIVSLWNTCYLLLAVILHHTHQVNFEEYCRASEWFTPINYILFLTSMELVFILPAYIGYIKAVRQFNRLRPQPDVTREEWLTSFTQDSYAGSSEVGHQHRGSNLEELLEKQADMIRYLRDHNVTLSRMLMVLIAQRSSTEA